jgi:hypothetical protein
VAILKKGNSILDALIHCGYWLKGQARGDMTDTENLRQPLTTNPRFRTILIGMIIVAIAHVFLIQISPAGKFAIELNISREAGQLWLNGVNNYKSNDGVEIRERLRNDDIARNDYVSSKQELWNLYTAAAPPGSTLFYAGAEAFSGGDAEMWRYVLLLGDLLIIAGGLSLLYRSAAPSLLDIGLAVFFLGFYPGLLRYGVVTPEEEQIQTGLILCFLAVAAGKDRTARSGALAGLLMGLAIAFKGMGVFFLPLLWVRYPDMRVRIVAFTLAIATVLMIFAPFHLNVLGYAMEQWRTVTGPGAGSASLFTILPLAMKPVLALSMGAFALASMVWRKIDLANFCAALLVTFVCILSTNVSIDTLGIAIMVATMTVASLSLSYWRVFAVINTGMIGVLYVLFVSGIKLAGDTYDKVDAVANLIFLISYVGVLAIAWLRPAASPRPSENTAATA